VGGIFIWLSGASRKILAECPTERPKYFGLGASIFVTGAMAGVSLAFALVNALNIALTGAIIFAVCWGLAIMMVDRLFVSSMHRQRNPLIYVMQATPRFLMSIVIGFVISTPFVLQIFKPEITAEVQQMQTAARAAYYRALPHNPVYLAVQADQKQYDTLKNEAAAGGTPVVVSDDQQIKDWTAELNHANTEVQNWTNQLDCQLYGGTINGVKCPPGYGPVGHDDQTKIDYWQGQADTFTKDIQSRTSQLETQNNASDKATEQAASAQLPAAKAALAAAAAQLTEQTKNVTSSIGANKGILEQLKALGNVTAGDFTLQMARLLLFLLFVLIDIMPVFVKLLINVAPAGAYDQILAEEEKMQVQDAENGRAVRMAARRQASQAQAAGMRYWYDVLRSPLPGAREDLMAVRQRVERQKRRRYEHQQLRDVATGQGFAGIGMRPGGEPWPFPLPGQPLGDGHRVWPPPGGGVSVDGQQPQQAVNSQAGNGGWAQGNGQGMGPAASLWTNGSSGRPASSGNQAGPGGPGPCPWTRQQPVQGPAARPQGAKLQYPEQPQPPRARWARLRSVRVRLRQLIGVPFLGGWPQAPAESPTAPRTTPLVGQDGTAEADTQPVRSVAAPPWAPAGPADPAPPTWSDPARPAWSPPAESTQPETFQPDFARPLPTSNEDTRPEPTQPEPTDLPAGDVDSRDSDPSVVEPLPDFPGTMAPGRYDEREDDGWDG